MSGLQRLREVAEAANDGRGWKWDHATVYTEDGEPVFEDVASQAADREHIATFDPPTVLALLDVAEAAGRVMFPDMSALTHDEAVARADDLGDALDRLAEVSS